MLSYGHQEIHLFFTSGNKETNLFFVSVHQEICHHLVKNSIILLLVLFTRQYAEGRKKWRALVHIQVIENYAAMFAATRVFQDYPPALGWIITRCVCVEPLHDTVWINGKNDRITEHKEQVSLKCAKG